MSDNVRVYHPVLDTFADVPAKTLPIRERKGWVPADDVAPISSDDEESTTPPLWGDNETPVLGEE